MLDLAGGLMVLIFVLPFLLTGIGWLAWRVIQSRMVTCEVCGVKSFGDSGFCPICGSQQVTQKEDLGKNNVPASSITIDITAESAEENNKPRLNSDI